MAAEIVFDDKGKLVVVIGSLDGHSIIKYAETMVNDGWAGGADPRREGEALGE
jgi:gamma-glutamyltranspeptidase